MAGLAPFDGDMGTPVPCWCVRPGEVEALAPAAGAMRVWLLVLSINGRELVPCIAGEDTLASTLGISRRSIQRLIRQLRDVPGLLLEIERPVERKAGRRRRPLARFALDPLAIRTRSPRIVQNMIRGRLDELAEMDGSGERWLSNAERTIAAHDTAARRLAEMIRADSVEVPSTVVALYAGRGGEGKAAEVSDDEVGQNSGTEKEAKKSGRAA